MALLLAVPVSGGVVGRCREIGGRWCLSRYMKSHAKSEPKEVRRAFATKLQIAKRALEHITTDELDF